MKQNYGKKIRFTTYILEPMYKALESLADPDEEERWEARIGRKALSEFLEKRGVQWRDEAPKKQQETVFVKPTAKVRVQPKNQKPRELLG